MALVAASILASAFAPHDQWLYAVKVVAIGGALWWFRGSYLPCVSSASWSSVVYALLMYRTKRLSYPIAAHVASNAAIMFWAVVAKSLL